MIQNMNTIKAVAKELIGDGRNTEYTRGICELIADLDGKKGIDHAERSFEIAIELGVNKDVAECMYK